MSVVNLMRLDGRVALVLGGAGHLGRVACDTLAQLGAAVCVADLGQSDGQIVADEVSTERGVRTMFIGVDASDDQELRTVPDRVVADLGRLDVIVHAAALVGTSNLEGWSVPFAEQSVESWRLAMEVNLTSAFVLCQAALPHLRVNGAGSIILVSSIYGLLAPDPLLYRGTTMASPAAYFVSKAGMNQLTRYLASTCAPEVRVNAICPGGIERSQDPLFVNRYAGKTPLGRLASEDDMRGAVVYLSSDLSRYVTGHVLMVDGGISIR